jgi:hypothetical protein
MHYIPHHSNKSGMPAEPSVDAGDFAQIPGSHLGRGCLQQLPYKRTVSQVRALMAEHS